MTTSPIGSLLYDYQAWHLGICTEEDGRTTLPDGFYMGQITKDFVLGYYREVEILCS